MISLYIAPPSKVDIENTFSSSMLCVWSVWGCFNFQRKMKKILRNINTSESVPKKGIMIKRMIFCPSFKICLPTRQGCNPVTIPRNTLLPCSASMWACLNALLLGRGQPPTYYRICLHMTTNTFLQKQLE